ncbi:winged helix-turn-helix transcriptional regulator [Aneurinibacillus sp. BA2021]|nr:winged helix-turn-helix transcriptional regulator [Aneurinibacillus sp. BA2021]
MKPAFLSEHSAIQYNGETIALLPKEYALLHYLFRYANRVCTREQLLDAVWPMEYPTDRTVDDHVYRLRKKLKRWQPAIKIETMRGQGYRLAYRETAFPHPFGTDAELTTSYTVLFDKYHLFGHGEAMQLLAAHQTTLGFHMAEEKKIFLEAVKGNFTFFLQPHLSFTQKAFYLLILYWYIQPDAERALFYIERALEKQVMPAVWHEEMKFNVIALYIETGRFTEAHTRLSQYEALVSHEKMKGLRLFYYNKKLLLTLVQGNKAEAAALVTHMTDLLDTFPYLREHGIFLIIKGLWLMSRQAFDQAEDAIIEGVTTLRESRFVPHLIYGTRLLMRFAPGLLAEAPVRMKPFNDQWNELAAMYDFPYLEKNVQLELERFL